MLNKKNFEKSLKKQKRFLIMLVKADQQYILKFYFICFWKILCLKHPTKKNNNIFIDNKSFKEYMLISCFLLFFCQYFSSKMVISFWFDNFLLSWFFSKVQIFSRVKTFLKSCKFCQKLRLFSRVENFLKSRGFCQDNFPLELTIFS